MITATRRFILLAAGVVFLGFFVATSVSAVTFNKTMHFRFSGAVALPGVVLPAGDYVFELADTTTTRNVVRVLNRQRSHMFLQALTRTTERHRNVKDGTLTFGESSSGTPRPIVARYPAADSIRYEFIY